MRRFGSFLSLFACILALAIYACKPKEKAQSVAKPKNDKETEKVVRTSDNTVSDLRHKLKVSEKEMRSNKLYHFSEEWYGVPYRYGGCDKRGVDCSCFANLLYENVYSKTLSRSANEIFKSCNQLSLGELQQGDLLFFKIGGNTISHVAVFLKDSYFIHSSTSKGVIVNSLEEAYYKKYFFCAGKLRKI